jgi:hypothetical protein
MLLLIAVSYWVGAALLWLPLALMLRRYNSGGMESVVAGLVLSTVWPVSLPIVALWYGTSHVRRHPVDVPESALLGI